MARTKSASRTVVNWLAIAGYEYFHQLLVGLGHVFFDQGDYNVNLIGIRSRDTASNTFNDYLVVCFRVMGVPQCWIIPCTTDPGSYYRDNPLNLSGTAWLEPGQHRGLWKLGMHQGKYPALVQRQPVTVRRGGPDGEPDTGWFGINLHRAAADAVAGHVDKFSAGCQVVQCPLEYQVLMAVLRKASRVHGNSFSYTLLDENQLTEQ